MLSMQSMLTYKLFQHIKEIKQLGLIINFEDRYLDLDH